MAFDGRLGRARTMALAIGMVIAVGACGDDDGTGPDGVCKRNEGNPTNINVGQTVQGTLATSDCKDTEGEYMDVYRLAISQQTTVTIAMSSQEFDAYLYLVDANGVVLDQNDDVGNSNNAAITRTLQPGTYYINASSFDENETGAYTLRVLTGTGGTGGSCSTTTLAGDIAVPATINGALATSDCQFEDGSYADIYRLSNGSSRQVTINMSASFDTYLSLYNSSGQEIAFNDDLGPGTTNSRIVITIPAGTFYVVANSFDPQVTGTYTLSTSSP